MSICRAGSDLQSALEGSIAVFFKASLFITRWGTSGDGMFTGIVQGVAEIVAIHEAEAFRTHVVVLPEALCEGLELGASVAHNGVCLTVTRIEGERVSFDLMRETLRITNLGKLCEGDHVNIERAARFGDEIGGHAMSGHVMAVAELVELDEAPNNRRLWFELPHALGRFLFDKGYIGVRSEERRVGRGCGCRRARAPC